MACENIKNSWDPFDAATNAVQDTRFCLEDLCSLLINRMYVFVQQYWDWFIIQTNEAQFLSKCYLLSDNENLGGHSSLAQSVVWTFSLFPSNLWGMFCLICFRSAFPHSSVYHIGKILPTQTLKLSKTVRTLSLLLSGLYGGLIVLSQKQPAISAPTLFSLLYFIFYLSLREAVNIYHRFVQRWLVFTGSRTNSRHFSGDQTGI